VMKDMREILAYVGAGIAATLTRFVLVFLFHIDGAAYADPPGIRIPPMLVFFAVLVLIDRRALQGVNTPRPAVVLNADDFAPKKTPQETAATMARVFGGVTDDQSRRGAIRETLSGIPSITVLIPFIFYLEFGIIGPLGWGLTVFFDAYCLLWALGLFSCLARNTIPWCSDSAEAGNPRDDDRGETLLTLIPKVHVKCLLKISLYPADVH